MSKKSKRRAEKRQEEQTERPRDEEFHFEDEGPVEPRVVEKMLLVYLLDQDEINRLIKASDTPYKAPTRPVTPYLNYPTYNQYECLTLLNDKPVEKKSKKK